MAKTLNLPAGRLHNWNQFCDDVVNAINSTKGCFYCCGLDLANIYGSRTYFPSDMSGTHYWTSNGYTMELPPSCGSINYYSHSGESASQILAAVKAEIDANRFVIVNMDGNGSEHYVVAYGYQNNGTTTNDIQVIDPANVEDRTSQRGLLIRLDKSMTNNNHPNLKAILTTNRP